jgi:hypothetical protein
MILKHKRKGTPRPVAAHAEGSRQRAALLGRVRLPSPPEEERVAGSVPDPALRGGVHTLQHWLDLSA